MVAPTVRVDGARELRAAIRRARDTELVAELKATHRDAAELVAHEAQTIVPVKSSRLLESIRAAGTQSAGIVRAGRAAVPYAGVIHFGHPRRNIEPNTFLYDAADARVEEVVAQYEQAIATVVDKVAAATPGATT